MKKISVMSRFCVSAIILFGFSFQVKGDPGPSDLWGGDMQSRGDQASVLSKKSAEVRQSSSTSRSKDSDPFLPRLGSFPPPPSRVLLPPNELEREKEF